MSAQEHAPQCAGGHSFHTSNKLYDGDVWVDGQLDSTHTQEWYFADGFLCPRVPSVSHVLQCLSCTPLTTGTGLSYAPVTTLMLQSCTGTHVSDARQREEQIAGSLGNDRPVGTQNRRCTKYFSGIESSPSTPRIFSPYEPVTIKKDVLEVHDLR